MINDELPDTIQALELYISYAKKAIKECDAKKFRLQGLMCEAEIRLRNKKCSSLKS